MDSRGGTLRVGCEGKCLYAGPQLTNPQNKNQLKNSVDGSWEMLVLPHSCKDYKLFDEEQLDQNYQFPAGCKPWLNYRNSMKGPLRYMAK